MNDIFHYFPQLPPEIRIQIWKLCLPYRIAENNVPTFLFDGCESRQACSPHRITYLNAQPPVIAYVNGESRQIAMEQGQIFKPETRPSLESIWVQPRRDVMQLNWGPLSHDYLGMCLRDPGSFYMFFHFAHDLGMPTSLIAEIIHPFNLEGLLEGGDGTYTPCSWDGDIRMVNGRIDYHEKDEAINDIAQWYMYAVAEGAYAEKPKPVRLDITMAGVSLHISKDVALSCGLFGLLGDAPVQMVDVDDIARLQEFESLYMEHAYEKEPTLQKHFELFATSQFRRAVETWKETADWTLLAAMWKQQYRSSEIPGDPYSAWMPPIDDPTWIHLAVHSLNEAHPWVKKARLDLPKWRPQIMVRYCLKKCYTAKVLPEDISWVDIWSPD